MPAASSPGRGVGPSLGCRCSAPSPRSPFAPLCFPTVIPQSRPRAQQRPWPGRRRDPRETSARPGGGAAGAEVGQVAPRTLSSSPRLGARREPLRRSGRAGRLRFGDALVGCGSGRASPHVLHPCADHQRAQWSAPPARRPRVPFPQSSCPAAGGGSPAPGAGEAADGRAPLSLLSHTKCVLGGDLKNKQAPYPVWLSG